MNKNRAKLTYWIANPRKERMILHSDSENKYDTAHLSNESIADLRSLEEKFREETGEEIVLIAYTDQQEK